MLTTDEALSLKAARWYAKRSPANRLKVGASLRIKNTLSLVGWNSIHNYGWDQLYEREAVCPSHISCEDETNATRAEVIHAEEMLITYAATKGYALEGLTLCVTHSPCLGCAKLIASCQIKKVVYIEDYRCSKGIDYLRSRNVEVVKAEGWSL